MKARTSHFARLLGRTLSPMPQLHPAKTIGRSPLQPPHDESTALPFPGREAATVASSDGDRLRPSNEPFTGVPGSSNSAQKLEEIPRQDARFIRTTAATQSGPPPVMPAPTDLETHALRTEAATHDRPQQRARSQIEHLNRPGSLNVESIGQRDATSGPPTLVPIGTPPRQARLLTDRPSDKGRQDTRIEIGRLEIKVDAPVQRAMKKASTPKGALTRPHPVFGIPQG